MSTTNTQDALLKQPKTVGERLLPILTILLIFSVMNSMIFLVVLPALSVEFKLIPSQASWVITIYMVTYAIGSVIYGKLADTFKLKNLLTVGFSVFALGGLLGILSQNFPMVVIARALQAAGAAVIPATSLMIPVRYFAPEKRGRAFAAVATGISIGAAIGPIVSGLISNLVGWRFLFLLSVLPLLTLPVFRRLLTDDVKKAAKIDVLGAILLAGSVASFLLSITQSSMYLLIPAVVGIVLFIWRIRAAANPFVHPKVFNNSRYTLGIVLSFLIFGFNMTIPFVFPMLLSKVNHMGTLVVGLLMSPAALLSAISSRTVGKLADSRGNGFLIWIAAATSFAGLLLLSSFAAASPAVLSAILLLPYLSFIVFNIAISNAVSSSLPKEDIGVGMGFFAMLNFIAGAIATSVAGRALDGSANYHLNPVQTDPNVFAYGNLFLILAVLPPVVAIVFQLVFRSPKKRNDPPRNAENAETA